MPKEKTKTRQINDPIRNFDPDITLTRLCVTSACMHQKGREKRERALLIPWQRKSRTAQHAKKLPLRLGHLYWSCALLKWIIAHEHSCSNNVNATPLSFQNGRSIQTYTTFSSQKKILNNRGGRNSSEKGKDSDQEVIVSVTIVIVRIRKFPFFYDHDFKAYDQVWTVST